MSGIVGIVNLDGEPIDRALLSRMTASLDFRGPDARQTWFNTQGNVAFGHTLLKTTFESEHEHQPFTLDGETWIVADARIDAQDDLISKLCAKPRASASGPRKGVTTDVELILHAWQVWGEQCVEHLLGDFAFAIWDAPTRRFFCARDHMGVKPFYYAHLGQTVIFSNTLDCIRQHPAVSGTLNDLAIADFLLFDMNQDPATTSFADIQRIPPAHRATWSVSGFRTSRYWTLPIDEPVYFKRANDYTERFKDLLNETVSDRLRTKKVGLFMSGGLDSTALAAVAAQILGGRSANPEVHAFTTLVDFVRDNKEREYAQLAADHLGLQIHYQDLRGSKNTSAWHQTSFHTSEPVESPIDLAADRECYDMASAHVRVCFYGEGPDNALEYEWRPYLSHLFQHGRFGRAFLDVGSLMIRHRRIPLLPSLPRMMKLWRRGDCWRRSFPAWLDESFESRLDLRARWEAYEHRPFAHPWRPHAYLSLSNVRWERLFSDLDAGETRTPVDVRHPFLDLRLLRYMLSVPVVPWCRVKHLLRAAMRGSLPDPVLRRPKAALVGDPAFELCRRSGLPRLNPASVLRCYIATERIPESVASEVTSFWTDFKPRALNYWLENIQPKPYSEPTQGGLCELIEQ